jgi:hypothetical protein
VRRAGGFVTGFRNQCAGSTFTGMSIARGLNCYANEEGTNPARSVPCRCHRINVRAVRIFRVRTMPCRQPKAW